MVVVAEGRFEAKQKWKLARMKMLVLEVMQVCSRMRKCQVSQERNETEVVMVGGWVVGYGRWGHGYR